ncbi:MAG: HEAT repeat domain-containing protein, partial [Nitrospirota bacterium]
MHSRVKTLFLVIMAVHILAAGAYLTSTSCTAKKDTKAQLPVKDSASHEEISNRILKEGLKNPDVFVRSSAIRAYGEIKEQGAAKDIASFLKDDAAFVRLFAVEALGNLDGEDVPQYLVSALDDKDPMVRIKVIEVIGRSSDENLLVALKKGLNDPDMMVRLFSA